MFEHTRIPAVVKRLVGCTAVAVAAVLSAPASAGAIFGITEGASIGVAPPNSFFADFLHGSYDELLTTTSINGAGTGGTFDSSAYFAAGSYTLGGITQISNLNGPPTNGYKAYATFLSPGTFTCSTGGVTSLCTTADRVDFTGTSGTINFYADPLEDNSFTPPPNGATPYTIANTGDDILLGSASLLTFGQGHEFPPPSTANGDYQLIWGDWALTAAGKTYFTFPDPFYVNLSVTGVFTDFNTTVGANTRTDGSANAEFRAVPEPGSLLLLGLGALAFGAIRRNKSV